MKRIQTRKDQQNDKGAVKNNIINPMDDYYNIHVDVLRCIFENVTALGIGTDIMHDAHGETDDSPATAIRIARSLQISPSIVQKALDDMVENGTIIRIGNVYTYPQSDNYMDDDFGVIDPNDIVEAKSFFDANEKYKFGQDKSNLSEFFKMSTKTMLNYVYVEISASIYRLIKALIKRDVLSIIIYGVDLLAQIIDALAIHHNVSRSEIIKSHRKGFFIQLDKIGDDPKRPEYGLKYNVSKYDKIFKTFSTASPITQVIGFLYKLVKAIETNNEWDVAYICYVSYPYLYYVILKYFRDNKSTVVNYTDSKFKKRLRSIGIDPDHLEKTQEKPVNEMYELVNDMGRAVQTFRTLNESSRVDLHEFDFYKRISSWVTDPKNSHLVKGAVGFASAGLAVKLMVDLGKAIASKNIFQIVAIGTSLLPMISQLMKYLFYKYSRTVFKNVDNEFKDRLRSVGINP